MKVVVTGAGGFLGARVADALLAPTCALPVSELVLTDVSAPAPRADPRVRCLALQLCAPGAADRLVDGDCCALFHLAAAVSGHAEDDFDEGLRINVDATRALLEAARRRAPGLRFVLASTVGVFGAVNEARDDTHATPQSSYGTAKAVCELLLNDYSRRGFVDGRAVRLPTVSVRAGAPNRAITSFASGIVREPLAGLEAVCPVPPDQLMWLTSPRAAVRHLVQAAALPAGALGAWRALSLPGLSATPAQIVAALRAVAGERVAALVRYEPDARLSSALAALPGRVDAARALALGFEPDTDFEQVIRDYITDELGGSIP